MSSSQCAVRRSPEPVRSAPAELVPPARPLVRRLGRVRVPLSLTQQPWATAYRLPSGKTIWCLRLPQGGTVVPLVVPTARLREYARRSGLDRLDAEIARIADPSGA
jgi:hypothetical protein